MLINALRINAMINVIPFLKYSEHTLVTTPTITYDEITDTQLKSKIAEVQSLCTIDLS